MNPHDIKSAEDDPRFREEPQDNQQGGSRPDRLVVPDTTQDDTKRAVERLKKARQTVQRQIAVSVTPDGKKIRRNGPCLCGSGRKFKVCCQLKIKSGHIPQTSLSGRPLPPTNQGYATRKLRKAAEAVAAERADNEKPG